MTVEEIYSMSKAWFFERPGSKNYDEFILPVFNKVLAEIYDDNNMLRMRNGKEALESIPYVTSRSDDLDELGIEEVYQRNVLPKGINANLLLDDDKGKMSKYDTEYENAVAQYKVILPSSYFEVEDV